MPVGWLVFSLLDSRNPVHLRPHQRPFRLGLGLALTLTYPVLESAIDETRSPRDPTRLPASRSDPRTIRRDDPGCLSTIQIIPLYEVTDFKYMPTLAA